MVSGFVHKYAIIFCNEFYDKLRKTYPNIVDLKEVRNDLINARAQVALMGIPLENIFELIDSDLTEI